MTFEKISRNTRGFIRNFPEATIRIFPSLFTMIPDFRIRPGTIDEAVMVSNSIPEFDNPYQNEEYIKRLDETPHIILVAELVGGEVVGFQAGYERDQDGSFYSWMGGIKPAYRKEGLANSLSHGMEVWAQTQGYTALRFKTRNCHRAMLHLAISDGFNIVGFEKAEEVDQHRIWLEKELG